MQIGVLAERMVRKRSSTRFEANITPIVVCTICSPSSSSMVTSRLKVLSTSSLSSACAACSSVARSLPTLSYSEMVLHILSAHQACKSAMVSTSHVPVAVCAACAREGAHRNGAEGNQQMKTLTLTPILNHLHLPCRI